jgi:DnaJ-class molecular chaperone
VTGTLILAVIAGLAVWLGSLYMRPFGRCRKCKGTGHIRRSKRRMKVCPRCKGRRRVQRHGFRTLHRLVFKIRGWRQAAARCQQEDNHGRT